MRIAALLACHVCPPPRRAVVGASPALDLCARRHIRLLLACPSPQEREKDGPPRGLWRFWAEKECQRRDGKTVCCDCMQTSAQTANFKIGDSWQMARNRNQFDPDKMACPRRHILTDLVLLFSKQCLCSHSNCVFITYTYFNELIHSCTVYCKPHETNNKHKQIIEIAYIDTA